MVSHVILVPYKSTLLQQPTLHITTTTALLSCCGLSLCFHTTITMDETRHDKQQLFSFHDSPDQRSSSTYLTRTTYTSHHDTAHTLNTYKDHPIDQPTRRTPLHTTLHTPRANHKIMTYINRLTVRHYLHHHTSLYDRSITKDGRTIKSNPFFLPSSSNFFVILSTQT